MSARWSKVNTADNDLMAQYSALSKPRFSRSAGAVLGKGTYSKAAMKGLGLENYTKAALRGMGRENYTRAALRGLGRENYTRAALRGMGGKRACGGSKFFDNFKRFLKRIPGLSKIKDGIENVATTVLPGAMEKLMNVTVTVLESAIEGKAKSDEEVTKAFAEVVVDLGKKTLEESKKELKKQLTAPAEAVKETKKETIVETPKPVPMEIEEEIPPPPKPLPPKPKPVAPSMDRRGSRGRALVPNFRNYDEFEEYLNSI